MKTIRDMLLCSRSQEGLLYSLTESPAVSGAQKYIRGVELSRQAGGKKNNELKKKQQYLM